MKIIEELRDRCVPCVHSEEMFCSGCQVGEGYSKDRCALLCRLEDEGAKI